MAPYFFSGFGGGKELLELHETPGRRNFPMNNGLKKIVRCSRCNFPIPPENTTPRAHGPISHKG